MAWHVIEARSPQPHEWSEGPVSSYIGSFSHTEEGLISTSSYSRLFTEWMSLYIVFAGVLRWIGSRKLVCAVDILYMFNPITNHDVWNIRLESQIWNCCFLQICLKSCGLSEATYIRTCLCLCLCSFRRAHKCSPCIPPMCPVPRRTPESLQVTPSFRPRRKGGLYGGGTENR